MTFVVFEPFKGRNEVRSTATRSTHAYVTLALGVREVVCTVVILDFLVDALWSVLMVSYDFLARSIASVCHAHPMLLLFCDSEQTLMLLMIELEFENFETIFVDSNDIYALVLVHFRLQFKFRDKVRDHFEVQDSNDEVDQVSCRINVSLFHFMLLIVEEREEPEQDHNYLQHKKNRCVH